MIEKQSIHKTVQHIFLQNPEDIFRTKDLVNILDSQYNIKTKKEIITTILTRLYCKNIINRTPTQLKDGHYYSKNEKCLEEVYQNHLLPYDFHNKDELISKIKKNKFQNLRNNSTLNENKFIGLNFVQKYTLEHIKSKKIQQFLVLLVAFTMCDGHLNQNQTKLSFFFRKESDAKLFSDNFKEIFYLENFRIKKSNNGDSYVAQLRKSSSIAKLLYKLGAPAGNKVFQTFLVPD